MKRTIAVALVLGGLVVGPGALAAEGSTCPERAAYSGPDRSDAPRRIWKARFDRPIEGELPAPLGHALDAAYARILQHVSAASVAVAIPGEGVWTAGPAGPARFQVASTTKTFIAAVVLQLVAEGDLALDETVERWFPEVPNASRMTVDDLLRHTNGLVSFNALPDFGMGYVAPDEAIAAAAAVPPSFCPGARFAYSNTGYAMLGRIVERLEGAPLDEVLERRLFRPLKLEATVLRRPADEVARTVVPGHESGAAVEAADAYATAWAAGGLASTAEDLVRFWHALLAGKVVAKDDLRGMFRQMAPMDPQGRAFYGRGVQLYRAPGGDAGPGTMVGHSGGIVGFTSVVAYAVEDDLFVAVVLDDKAAPAEAGLWALVQAVRSAR